MATRARRGGPERQIHNRVRVLRVEAGMSRADLAARVGVNPQTIGALERGDHYPSLDLAMSVCEVFDVPIEAAFARRPFESVGAAYRRSVPDARPDAHPVAHSGGRPDAPAARS